jgi:hypothetical protein
MGFNRIRKNHPINPSGSMTNKVQLFFLEYQEEVNLEGKTPSSGRREDPATMHLQSPSPLSKELRELHIAQRGTLGENSPQDGP